MQLITFTALEAHVRELFTKNNSRPLSLEAIAFAIEGRLNIKAKNKLGRYTAVGEQLRVCLTSLPWLEWSRTKRSLVFQPKGKEGVDDGDLDLLACVHVHIGEDGGQKKNYTSVSRDVSEAQSSESPRGFLLYGEAVRGDAENISSCGGRRSETKSQGGLNTYPPSKQLTSREEINRR